MVALIKSSLWACKRQLACAQQGRYEIFPVRSEPVGLRVWLVRLCRNITAQPIIGLCDECSETTDDTSAPTRVERPHRPDCPRR